MESCLQIGCRNEERIFALRERRVMLDVDLACLYGVETKVLLQAVKRNIQRFPEDFMFQLVWDEWEILRSQIVTSKVPGRGGRRYPPYAFTELGIAMLSSVLNNARAIAVNIEIMRAFVRLRETVTSNVELLHRLEELERNAVSFASRQNTLEADTRRQIAQIFEVLRDMMAAPKTEKKRAIGFITPDE